MKGFAVQLNENSNQGQIFDLKMNIVRDEEGKILRGLSIGDTLEQNKAIILIIHPGELKERPIVGVGISDILLGSDLLIFRHKIRTHFAYDGLKVTELKLYNLADISIKANY
jgi:hypothetical protein